MHDVNCREKRNLNVPPSAKKLLNVMNCPMLISDYSSPIIKWHQTDLTIVISIQLTDITDYYLRVEEDCLQFSTKTNERKYYLILQLFGAVIAEKTVHKNVGREIKIYLMKGLKWFPWLRLIKLKEKNPLISYNLDYIQDTEIRKTYDVNKFERYKREHDIKYIMPAGSSSDEEESEDEDYIDFNNYA